MAFTVDSYHTQQTRGYNVEYSSGHSSMQLVKLQRQRAVDAVYVAWREGLVEVQPRSGTFVAKLSVQDIEETFEIRCALECLAAEKPQPPCNPPIWIATALESRDVQPVVDTSPKHIYRAEDAPFTSVRQAE